MIEPPAPRRSPLPAAGARAALAAAVLLGGGCAAESEPLSAVLITLDTTRADALACYGSAKARTPHLDRLAKEGVLYESAYTVTALTLPAHASMLTGLYPIRHTLRENLLWSLPDPARTLAENARAGGYQTAAFIAAVVLDSRFGLTQGFDVYDTPTRQAARATSHAVERPGPDVAAQAVAWLRGRDRERPFFLWMHLFDPHAPWEAPADLLTGSLADEPYLAEVANADRAVGLLVDALREEGLLDTTLVAVVGDHGEALDEHGETAHGAYCYQSTMRVPFLLRYPDGWRAGERSDEVVSVVDVYPTLCEAMGLAAGSDHDAESLYRRRVAPDRGVYLESYSGYMLYGWSQLVGWVDADGKYLYSSEPQYFDLRDDPRELRNVIEDRDVDRYRAAIQDVATRRRLDADAATIDVETRSDMEALGYGAVGAPSQGLPEPLEPSDRPSPQSRVEAHRIALEAMELTNAGQIPRAEAMLRRVVAENPNNHFAVDRLTICLLRRGVYDEAIVLLRGMLAEGPQWAFSYYNLGMALASVGKQEESAEAFREALALDAGIAATIRILTADLRRRGKEDVASYLETELELQGS